jgi:hypothetical protein
MHAYNNIVIDKQTSISIDTLIQLYINTIIHSYINLVKDKHTITLAN